MDTNLDVICDDDHIIAINKPSGLLVHRSPIDRHETRFALQLVRNYVGAHVYPVHRLDKPTSGVLVFAKSSELCQQLQNEWPNVRKQYRAVVRGHPRSPQRIDKALKPIVDQRSDSTPSEPQDAITALKTLSTTEVPIEYDKYPSIRLAQVELELITGRRHQLRRHMKHVSHPIIGDAKYGKGPLNRLLSERCGLSRLMLHCESLTFTHPETKEVIELNAAFDQIWTDALNRLDWHDAL